MLKQQFPAFVSIIFLALMSVSCKKESENPSQEKTDIFHKELNQTLNFDQTGSLKVDMNQDATYDFEIYPDKYDTPVDGLKGFFVRCLGENKTAQIKLTDNPLFDSMNLMSYTTGNEISASLGEEYSWSAKNGLLAIRHDPQMSFIGRWSDRAAKTMAVRLSLAGKNHYGWMKLQYSRENNAITLISYAYQKIPKMAIKVQ